MKSLKVLVFVVLAVVTIQAAVIIGHRIQIENLKQAYHFWMEQALKH